jgi:hypothetical protein
MTADAQDRRTLRLFDLSPTEVVVTRCLCGQIVEFGNGILQRRHRIPSDTLIYDLQFKLRCSHCNRTSGFTISVLDRNFIGASSRLPPERVIVEGGS